MRLALAPEERAKRNRQILRLAKEEVQPYLIVKRVPGATHAIVGNVMFQARLRGEIPGLRGNFLQRRGPGSCSLTIPADIVEFLRPAAIARGVGIADLARHILIAIADGGLVDAVLDDGVKSETSQSESVVAPLREGR